MAKYLAIVAVLILEQCGLKPRQHLKKCSRCLRNLSKH